jgi:SAM-dependent methyltransferase
LSSKDFFDRYYQAHNQPYYSKSLYSFFNEIVLSKFFPHELRILELGGGSFSLFEDFSNLKAEITSIDFSKEAINKAPKSRINYLEMDITGDSFDKAKYDLVFDSHCLNCITDEEQRKVAFKNIYGSLKPDGIFASELMVQPSGEFVSMPLKVIKTARELEEEILSHGLRILSFMVLKTERFGTVVDGREVECDLLRVVAGK